MRLFFHIVIALYFVVKTKLKIIVAPKHVRDEIRRVVASRKQS